MKTTCVLILLAACRAWAQPQPGAVFREYVWTKVGGDAGGSLRVGGQVGYGGGPLALPHWFFDHVELYDTRADVGETNNVSAAHPHVVKVLATQAGDGGAWGCTDFTGQPIEQAHKCRALSGWAKQDNAK